MHLITGYETTFKIESVDVSLQIFLIGSEETQRSQDQSHGKHTMRF
jgi:hypothetical protein